jgi:hypothetical protein
MSARIGGQRIAAALALVTAVTVLPLSCNSKPGLPEGYVAGPVFGVPTCCADGDYLLVASLACPRSSCMGPAAYAWCNAGSYTGCTCVQPAQGELALPGVCDGGDSGDVGEGSFEEADVDSFCGDEAFEDAPADAPPSIFDVGDDNGECSGLVAKRVVASRCDDCEATHSHSYLLCDGMFFSRCSCTLPPGYMVFDAGAPEDSGSKKDATSKDATMDSTHEVGAETGG